MPNYLFQCPTCKGGAEVHLSFEDYDSAHFACPDDGTELRRVLTSFYIGANARPSDPSAANTIALNEKQKRWDKDIAAVQQMKREGIVPKKVDGADEWLSKATDRMEIEQFTKYNNVAFAKEVTEELKQPKSIEEVKKIGKMNTKTIQELV